MASRADDELAFLAAHQPLPTDDVLDQGLIERFEQARQHFVQRPDPRCLPLFLRSLPKGSGGFGVYQLLDDVLDAHERNTVVAELADALTSDVPSHAWVLELALPYDDPQLRVLVRPFLESSDDEERLWAETYLTSNES